MHLSDLSCPSDFDVIGLTETFLQHEWKQLPFGFSDFCPVWSPAVKVSAMGRASGSLVVLMLRDRSQKWSDRERILDASQAGFRPGRGCLDQIFVLTSAIQLQLRLGSRKVFSVFVDFRRVFDSVPHVKLRSKLLSLGLSPKIVKIVKSLYDCAAIRVKSGGSLTNEIPVAEGVLQDLEKYLRNLGFKGVNINGRDDVLLLLYADDLVVLTESEIMLQKILDASHCYCLENDLTVNSDKTKAMVFREGGKLSPSLKFFYDGKALEIVSKYTYLGVLFSSSSLGSLAAREAVCKAKQANSTVLSLRSGGKCDSWSCMLKLFESISKPTLLYACPV
ncbi:uncharacterized protein LOC107042480 [Diachasma alloeum]|uniref:uncharacterized protein LOC107042480 n=1 Tax=Diachasma alloeum TaxID=454923 RepID=UPI0007383AB5|nr:uncharacterized protein LOC107042480 [Diachasma alloeum]